MSEPELKQSLKGWQIFFIVASATIGGGVFANNGEALEVAGPAGLLVSLLVIGLVIVATTEGLSELTQLFPAPNAVMEYVSAFIDRDWAWVVGVAYWYTNASVYATMNLSAANLSNYWGLLQMWQIVAFYFFLPVVALAINFVGVWLYGIIETVGGVLKILLVLGSAILMYVLSGKIPTESSPINDGFVHNPTYTLDRDQAVCFAIPLVAFSFTGVESFVVTAFEASTSKAIRFPSQTIAYFILVIYILVTIGEVLLVRASDPRLPLNAGDGTRDKSAAPYPHSSAYAILGVWDWGSSNLAGFLNACLIFSVLSASNSLLYMASRTLYGMTRELPTTNAFGRAFRKLSYVVPRTGVPAAALCVSAISFIWLPFLQLQGGYAIQKLIQIMSVSASVSALIVWGSFSVAFIRYHRWLDKCRPYLVGDYARYDRRAKTYQPYTVFAFAQPIPAYVGAIGCFLVVFVFGSAPWWNGKATFYTVAVSYAAPILTISMWLVLKAINRRWWVQLDDDFGQLLKALKKLHWLKRDQKPEMYDISSQDDVQAVA